MLKAICLVVVLLPGAGVLAAERTTVTQVIDRRQLHFEGSLRTMYEGLAVALVGSCHTETTLQLGNKEHWDAAAKGDHMLVTFAKPRVFTVNDQQDSAKENELEAAEILIPIGPYESPPQIYVRNGDHDRVFSKYDFQVSNAFQKALQNLLPLNAPKEK